jgi:hypothetical protein
MHNYEFDHHECPESEWLDKLDMVTLRKLATNEITDEQAKATLEI